MKKRMLIFCSSLMLINGAVFSQWSYNGKLGYGFSPKGHPLDYSLMADFLEEVANTCDGGIVLANGSWRETFNSSGYIPQFQKDISLLQPAYFNYVDMLVFGWGTPTQPYTLFLDVPGNSTNNWTNADAKTLFLQMLIHAADSLQPSYLFVGNEISFYWEQDSTDFYNWLNFYYQAYDSIKAHSPATMVGTVYNYEHLSGNGFQIGWNTPYWNSLFALDTSKIDILGITLYPFFEYQEAQDVPNNYILPIFNFWGNKPLAITETGWPTDSLLANWYCSPQQQVEYVNKLFSMIENHDNVEVVNWLFLYYLIDISSNENKLAASIAMYDSLGNPQPALPLWLSHCTSTRNSELQINTNDLTVYPNPSAGALTISTIFEMQEAEVEIYSISGKSVFKQTEIAGKEVRIASISLVQGMYFLRLFNGEKTYIIKLLIN
jgi:hypothetical protein